VQNAGVIASVRHVLAIAEVNEAPAEAFTAAERAYADSKSDPLRRLAARLAAKRAASELLGVPIGEIEILPARGGPPRLSLSASAQARLKALGATSALVSLSHGRTHAAAAVLLLGPGA
jgi:holo-[acyl-carrier protein] synthase